MAGEMIFSTNGATYDSPGHRPGLGLFSDSALNGRHNGCSALSGLGIFSDSGPRVSPRAIPSCPVGAEERGKMPHPVAALRERFAKRAVLEKQMNANMEGMGYGG